MKTLDYLGLNEARTNETVNALQKLLADYQVYYTNLRGFHWNIQGKSFFVLHAKLEELYDGVSEKADELAERILTLGGVPENRYSEYLKTASVKEASGVTCGREALKNVLDTLKHLIGEDRKTMETASVAGDEGTAAMMSDYLREQEKLVWMLTAYMAE